MELLPFYLASFFLKSPESYLSPSRGAVWGYFGYRSNITEPLGFVQDA